MGTFSVLIGVSHPQGGDLEQVLAQVDTRAAHSVMPASLLEGLGISPAIQRPVRLAEGRRAMQVSGLGRFSYRGEEWICPVVFGPEDQYLLGATALAAFRVLVDPEDRQLLRKPPRGHPLYLRPIS